jgi:geranylgeranyl diphosphate synthase, type II
VSSEQPSATEPAASGFQHFFDQARRRVEETLERQLPPPDTPPAVIHEAMRYSVLAGGKRLRPVLLLAAAEACGSGDEALERPAAALELIHTYSLIHDDLPALDDDELRRGRPTSHVVFGEAMAILAGDALLTEAFSWLSAPIAGVDAARQLRAVSIVAAAIDSRGMIGGQVADLEAERILDGSRSHEELLDALRFIHANKTGRLLTAAVVVGGLLAGAEEKTLGQLEEYGRTIGLAFQIVDDLLDLEETAETLGKTAGKDLAQGKLTWPALVGVERARQEADRLLERAVQLAGELPERQNHLGALARYICQRRS